MHYIEEKNPDLAELLRLTCNDMTLSALRGKTGITFLMPDAKLTEDIRKLAESSDASKAEEGAAMLSALILRDIYCDDKKKGPLFRKGFVANCMWPPQQVAVDSVSSDGKVVTFANKATATVASDFVEMRSADKPSKLAVWKYSGPHYGITNSPAPAPTKPQKRAPYEKKIDGGYNPSSGQLNGIRFKVMLAVEQDYVHDVLSNSGGLNAYRRASLSLLEHLKLVNPGRYNDLLSLVAFDNFDFYLLVQPHLQSDSEEDFLIDTDTIMTWSKKWRAAKNVDYMKTFKTVQHDLTDPQGKSAALFTRRKEVLEAIKDAREKNTIVVTNKFRSCVDHIETAYATLERDNRIGEVGDVFPAFVHEHFSKNEGLKLLYDDLRYISYLRFEQLENRPHCFDFGEFNSLVNFIGDALVRATKDLRDKARYLVNRDRVKYMIAPTMECSELICFINSTMFLCVPVTGEDRDLLGKNTKVKPTPGKISALFNIHAAIEESYNHLATATFTSLIDDLTWLTPEQRTELMSRLVRCNDQ
jgi:hypothetical protein